MDILFSSNAQSTNRGHTSLTDFCRACLKKTEDMHYLLNNCRETNTLLAKFASILNLKVGLEDNYPSYLCKICEEKINSFFEFQEKCKEANDLIFQYCTTLRNETNDPVRSLEFNLGRKSATTSNITDDHNYSEISRVNKRNAERFQQCQEEKPVGATREALNGKNKQDFVCIFCDFQLTTSNELLIHVTEAHQNNMDHWCSVCNKLCSDIKEHSEVHQIEDSSENDIQEIVLKNKEVATNNSQSNFELFQVKEVSKRNNTSQRMRLKQYNIEDVDRVVKMVRAKLYQHVICIFCQFEASSNRTLSVHVTRTHREFKGRWCSACNKPVDNLSLHNKEVHCEDLKCPFCNKIKSNMGHFMEHMASHSGSRLHKCPICHKSFISPRHLRSHQETHVNERPFGCKMCKKRFLQPKILRAHIRAAHGRKPDEDIEMLQEDITCDQSYRDNTDETGNLYGASDHANDAEDSTVEPQNYCKKCDKKVRSLQHHNSKCHSVVPAVTDERKNLCPHCGKQFRTMSKLTLHIRTHTGETPYKCQYCDRRLKSRNILVVHERTHTGEKPYSCTLCGKSFAQSSVLNTHLRIHNGRPEQCTICEKRFCRPAELKLHMRKHTGEKPYMCDLCDQRFKQRSHLVEHTKRHSDDRPFKCNCCEKAFKNISTLKSHLQIHTGDKPFKCSQCSYACRQPYSLTQHMQQHDTDKPQPDYPHICGICQKGFSTVAHLTTHYNRFHSHLSLQKPIENSNDHTANVQFVQEAPPQSSIVVDGSSHIRIETLEQIETTVLLQGELNQPKFDPMFEFTVIQ